MYAVMERITRFKSEVVECFETEQEAYDCISSLDQILLEQNIFTGKNLWRFHVEKLEEIEEEEME